MNLLWDFRNASPHLDLPAMYQAFVGHELLNQLVAAQGVARLLVETATELSEANRAMLTRLADRIRETDEQARRVAEIGRTLREPAYGLAWPVKPLLQESLTQMSALSRSNDISYSSKAEARTLCVSSVWFRRILRELLHNAQQAIGTDRSGAIEVEVSSQGNRCTVRVCDTGVGFRDQDCAALLAPFQPGRRFRSQGIGLGFFLIRQILQPWKGTFQIESRPGATCVSLEFASTEEE
jgi:signal transduction histidine kinase